MTTLALVFVALVATVAAKPLGLLGGIGHKTSHVSSHQIISPYIGYGLGYGMMGMHGLGMGGIGIGHSLASHSVSHHVVPHLGMGLMGLKGLGVMYPGGIGMGYGIGMMG